MIRAIFDYLSHFFEEYDEELETLSLFSIFAKYVSRNNIFILQKKVYLKNF